jgi:hypothetical protein
VIKFIEPKVRHAGGRNGPRFVAVSVASAFAIWALAYVVVAMPKATTAGPLSGPTLQFEMCGRVRQTCVVDGDTIWL